MDQSVEALVAKHPLISDQVNAQQMEVILRELQRVLETSVPGEVVELGCYIGTTSLFIRRLLDQSKSVIGPTSHKEFHVYDSFEGLPSKSTWDASITGESFTQGALAVSKKAFLREFQKARLAPPVIHKGWFKDLTPADMPGKIAFAFLDGDFYESIRDSLRLVLPRMQKGGVIIVDDYAREALPGTARAVHELLPATKITVTHNLGIYHTELPTSL